MKERDIAWNLSEMFSSPTDPSIQKFIDDLTQLAENLAKKYEGKVKILSAKELLQCIRDFEGYISKLNHLKLFAMLSYEANTTSPDNQTLRDKVYKTKAKLDGMLTFFNTEVGNTIDRKPEIADEKILQNYRHFLERLRRENLHRLSEVEEKLIIEKDQYGINEWEVLRHKWLNTRTFEVEVEGRNKALSFSEAAGFQYDPEQATRESVIKSVFGLLGKDGEIFSAALRNICNDWLSVCQRRKYGSPMEASLIANDIDEQTINNMVVTVGNHTDLYRRYLLLKAKILKIPILGSHDIVAPIPSSIRIRYDYDTAKRLVIEAYNRFDEDYAFAIKDMFARNHIDATPRLGKACGAFSMDWYEGKSAFILTNFNRDLADVYVLAHEFGHSTHSYYCQHSQTILNCGMDPYFESVTGVPIPAIVAETASIFGELLLTDLLLSKSKSNEERKPVICSILDSAGYTIFQVMARTWFEQSLYAAIKRGEFLDYKTICRYWVEARDKIFGDSVENLEESEAFWISVPQYYIPNFRYYNYPYVYAQLFVYALYQKYLEEGKGFVPKFKKALSVGCSVSPVEIGKIVGLDVKDSRFWELGLKQYGYFVKELEKIVT